MSTVERSKMFGALKLTFPSFDSMMWDTLNAYDCCMKRRKALQPMQMFCQSNQYADTERIRVRNAGNIKLNDSTK